MQLQIPKPSLMHTTSLFQAIDLLKDKTDLAAQHQLSRTPKERGQTVRGTGSGPRKIRGAGSGFAARSYSSRYYTHRARIIPTLNTPCS
jgi:hypothetical protein